VEHLFGNEAMKPDTTYKIGLCVYNNSDYSLIDMELIEVTTGKMLTLFQL